MADWTAKSFNIPSDNTSYFSNVEKETEKRIRAEVTKQIVQQAGEAINRAVADKDKEIAKIVEQIDIVKEQKDYWKGRAHDLEARIEKLELDLNNAEGNLEVINYVSGTVSDDTDFEIINNAFTQAIKYGTKTEDNLNDSSLELIREIVLKWKAFFEEYKWKSNYISNKIRKLLKETNDML